jgi:hypothetical protein
MKNSRPPLTPVPCAKRTEPSTWLCPPPGKPKKEPVNWLMLSTINTTKREMK